MVAVVKCVLLEPPLDGNVHRATIVNRRRDLAQPDIAIGIPARNPLGRGTCPTIRPAFGDEVVAASKDPPDVVVASHIAIQVASGSFAQGW